MKYNFDKEINRLNTGSYKWDMKGEEYLPLWVADTDFEVPPAVTARLQKRVDHGLFGYLLTGNGIYDAITGWFKRVYGIELPGKECIKLLPGIIPALAVASNMWSDGVSESLVCVPNYGNLIEAPESAGNRMIKVPMKNKDEYYTIDFEALQDAVTENTKFFYLCNPHNPVGRVYSYDELKRVSEFACRNNLFVISDEVHCEIVFEGKHIPFFTVDEYAREHSICLYSNGKLCNLADLIMAFAIIPNESARKEFARVSFAFVEEHVMNVEAGIATFAESDDWKTEMLDYLRDNRDYAKSEIAKRFPKAKMTDLEGTYLLWADFRAYGEDVNASYFYEKGKLFLSPGDAFCGEDYVRINLATRRAVLAEAFDRMENALKDRL